MAAGKLVLTGGRAPKLRRPGRRQFGKVKQDRFFAALADTCNVREACRQAQVHSTTVYQHHRRDAAFRSRWAEALRDAYARLELMMLERMMNGTMTTKTRADGSVETIHQYPNAIALQLLRLHRQSAAQAQAEPDPQEIEEVRERIARRIERLRERMQREAVQNGTEQHG